VRAKSTTDAALGEDLCGDASRPQRADAQRNRARLLAAAEAVFAAEGISVPVDLIAEKAGVGVGTLYRHFPTKEKLFEAVLLGRIDDVAQDALSRINADDPGTAFFAFLAHLVEESTSKRDLIQALLGAGVEIELAVADSKRHLEDAVSQLLEVAQRSRAVRDDVSSAVVLSLVGATCIAADHPHGAATPEAVLAIICDGLRPPATVTSEPPGIAASRPATTAEDPAEARPV
jgi:AcrR family transcriptional regulator